MLLCATAISTAQESDVDVIAPSRITQDLISRSDLNRLLNQPPQDRNPLRRTIPQPQSKMLPASKPSPMPVPLPMPMPMPMPMPEVPRPIVPRTIQDQNVQPTSWQEEQPSSPTKTPVAQPDQPVATFGPPPSFAMEILWNMQDMLVEIPIEKLQVEIANRRSTIESSVTIDKNSKSALLEQLQIADTAAQQAIQHTHAKADFQKWMIELPASIERLKQQSKETHERSSIDQSLSIEAMELATSNLQSELDYEKSKVRKIQDLIQRRDDRMAGIPTEKRQSRNRMDQLHEEFVQKQAMGTEDIEVLLALRAKELEASTKIQLLDTEASWHDQSQEKLPLEKAIYQQKLQQLEKEVNAWNSAIANRKRAELNKQIRLARQQAIDTHSSLKELSQETTELAQARAKLADKINALQTEILKVDKQSYVVDDQFDRLDSSIRDHGKDQSRELLIEVHRNLIRPFEGMARIRKIASEKQITGGEISKLRAEHDKTSDSVTFIREHLKIEHDVKIADTTLIAMAEEAIETYRKQLTAIIGDQEHYKNLLNDLQTKREPLLKKIAETRKLVDTHALWVQSADPFSVALITKSGQGAKEFFDYGQWRSLGNSIVERFMRRPYECAIGMIGLLIAFVVGRRFKG